MTHEECIAFHAAREIRSYRELPQIWYHIQTKERDEPRPERGHPAHARVHDEGLLQPRPRRGRAGWLATRSTARRTGGSSTAAACALDGRVGRRHDGRRRRPRVHGAVRGRARTRSRCARLRLRRQRGDRAVAARGRRSSPRRWMRPARSRRPASPPSRGWPRSSASTRRPPPRRCVVHRDGRSCWRWCGAITGCTS